MDVWQLALFAVASFVALRSLISLMAQHKRRFLEGLVAEEVRNRKKHKTAAAESGEAATESKEAAA